MMLMFRKHSYTIVQLCISVVFLYNFAYVQATIQCARTQDEWNKASASMQCQEPNYYHCLRNENGILTQQCLQRVWIQNGMSLLIHIIQLILDNDNKKGGMRIWWLFLLILINAILYIRCTYIWDSISFFIPKKIYQYKVIFILFLRYKINNLPNIHAVEK